MVFAIFSSCGWFSLEIISPTTVYVNLSVAPRNCANYVEAELSGCLGVDAMSNCSSLAATAIRCHVAKVATSLAYFSEPSCSGSDALMYWEAHTLEVRRGRLCSVGLLR